METKIDNHRLTLAEPYAHLAASANYYADHIIKATNSGAENVKPVPKVVFMCMRPSRNRGRSREIDPLTARLPDHLFPKTTSEVKTIIALYWDDVEVATYGGLLDKPIRGFRRDCEMRFIDVVTQRVIREATLRGGELPKSTKSKRDVYGPLPDVVTYVSKEFE